MEEQEYNKPKQAFGDANEEIELEEEPQLDEPRINRLDHISSEDTETNIHESDLPNIVN